MPVKKDPRVVPTSPTQTARDHFTNREEEKAVFKKILEASPDDPRPVLMFYGVGGIGKSSLLAHLKELAEERNTATALVNLAESPTPFLALARLAQQLRENHNIKFPEFDLVLSVFVAKEQGTKKLRQGAGSGDAIDTLLEVGGLLPGIAEMANWIKLSKTAFVAAVEKSKHHGNSAKLLHLFGLDTLEEELVRTFALDLGKALDNNPQAFLRVALFLDTHESLWRDGSGGQMYEDNWIRELYTYLPAHNAICLVVAGRDQLEWAETDSSWNNRDTQGRLTDLEQHLVGGLSEHDAKKYLYTATGSDAMPNDLMQAILAACNESDDHQNPSHHCLKLALCSEIIRNELERNKTYPNATDFALTTDKNTALVKRFLTSLPNQRYVNWLQELSLAPRFDEDYALELAQHRRYNLDRTDWERLTQLSFLKKGDAGLWDIHKILHEELRQQVSSENAQLIHAWSKDHWLTRSKNTNDDLVLLGFAWFHWRYCNHDEAMAEYDNWFEEFYSTKNWRAMREVYRWWEDLSPNGLTKAQQAKDFLKRSHVFRLLPKKLIKDFGEERQNAIALDFLNNGLNELTETQEEHLELLSDIHHEIAMCYSDGMGDSRKEELLKSERHLLLAKNGYEKLKNTVMVGKCYRSLGYNHRRRHFVGFDYVEQLKRSEKCYQMALELAGASELVRYSALQGLGFLCWNKMYVDPTQSAEEALGYFLQASRLKKTDREASFLLLNMADFIAEMVEINRLPVSALKKGFEFCKQSLETYGSSDTPGTHAQLLAHQAHLTMLDTAQTSEIRFQKAKDLLDEAIKILDDEQELNEPNRTTAESKLARWYLAVPYGEKQSNLDKAYDLLQRCLTKFQSNDRERFIARTQIQLGLVEKARGNNEEAKKHLQAAYDYYTSLGMVALAQPVQTELESIS